MFLQLSGFLELLVEFYRCCLIQIFGILEEYEVGAQAQKTLKEAGLSEDLKEAGLSEGQAEEAPLLAAPEEREDNKLVQEDPELRPRQSSKFDKLPIKVEETGEGWEEVEERWARLDQPNGFTSGLLHWRAGGGDSTAHIHTHFEPATGDFTPPDPDPDPDPDLTEGGDRRGPGEEGTEGRGGEVLSLLIQHGPLRFDQI